MELKIEMKMEIEIRGDLIRYANQKAVCLDQRL